VALLKLVGLEINKETIDEYQLEVFVELHDGGADHQS